MESILESVKMNMGIIENYTVFDEQLVMNINMVFSILYEIGAGPSFYIDGDNKTWSDYTTDKILEGMVKQYMYLSVKMIFDPPTSSIAEKAAEDYKKELETRIYWYVDSEGGLK